jgi:hydroxyacylglutathione hydrolase
LIIKGLTVGPIQANCFIVGCEKTKEAVVIDPGDEADRILMTLAESNLSVKYIINTHGHFDHVGANKRMKEATGADLLIHSLEVPLLSLLSASATAFGLTVENSPGPDKTLEDGDIISFGEIEMKTIHTPGHSEGGISLYADNNVFVGDTLFAGSVGRTDLPGGDFEILKASIQKKLFPLGEDVKVFPGHMGDTTMGQEMKYNPFVRL